MAQEHHIRNPLEMAFEKLSSVASDVDYATTRHRRPRAAVATPQVRKITTADLVAALRAGFADLGATRGDILFAAVLYPLAGLFLARLAFRYDLLPMIFPLASGFAILGPVAAVGLYEISRRRELGEPVTLQAALAVLRSPSLGAMVGLGMVMVGLFLAWLAAAYGIYQLTLGPTPPASISGFARDVLTTPAGWTMTIVGIAVGAVFAVVALAISVVSFPLLLDRDVGLSRAVATSLHAVRANSGTMLLWGAIVAAALLLGSIPALIGLIVVVPLLGHATWHLYRRVVAEP